MWESIALSLFVVVTNIWLLYEIATLCYDSYPDRVDGLGMRLLQLVLRIVCTCSQDQNFTAFIDALTKVNTTGFNRNETCAFFMNVYNALAIKMIIDHPCHKPLIGYVPFYWLHYCNCHVPIHTYPLSCWEYKPSYLVNISHIHATNLYNLVY